MSQFLKVEKHRAVAVLTLCRPERRNALTVGLAQDLTDAIAEAEANPAVRALQLRGEGGHFCSGLDLQDALRGIDATSQARVELVRRVLIETFHPLLLAVWRCQKPTLAVLEGASVGIGLSLALACDVRVMADTAYLSSQFAARGLMPDGGLLYQLERLCGLGRALNLALRPELRLSAAAAEVHGLSSATVPQAQLDETVGTLAAELARGAPLPQREIKRALRGETFAQVLAKEIAAVEACIASEDALEGLTAFLEKRPPKFVGR